VLRKADGQGTASIPAVKDISNMSLRTIITMRNVLVIDQMTLQVIVNIV
jgi:hypothetical protein